MLKPLNGRVIVKVVVEETSPGGIVLPSSEQEKPTSGQILACSDNEQGIEAGDIVLFSKFAGTQMKVNGEQVLIMKIEDLIAKL